MQTIVVDIISNRAFKFLRYLEKVKLIRLRTDKVQLPQSVNFSSKYKGRMSLQPLEEIEKHLKDLRNEWE